MSHDTAGPASSGSTLWRWIVFDADRLVRDAGEMLAWRHADLRAVADEKLADYIARHGTDDMLDLVGMVCRVWRGEANPNRDGVPVDEAGYEVEFGDSKGDDWYEQHRRGQAEAVRRHWGRQPLPELRNPPVDTWV